MRMLGAMRLCFTLLLKANRFLGYFCSHALTTFPRQNTPPRFACSLSVADRSMLLYSMYSFRQRDADQLFFKGGAYPSVNPNSLPFGYEHTGKFHSKNKPAFKGLAGNDAMLDIDGQCTSCILQTSTLLHDQLRGFLLFLSFNSNILFRLHCSSRSTTPWISQDTFGRNTVIVGMVLLDKPLHMHQHNCMEKQY